MRMNKSIAITIMVIIGLLTPFAAQAETINAYASVDDSSNVANLLTDVMRSDSEYDPYNEYAIIRVTDTQYVLVFAPKLSGNRVVKYTYTIQTMGQPATIYRTITSNVTVNRGSYICVGNLQGFATSALSEQYKTQYVLVVLAVVIVIYLMIRHHKKSEGARVQYYKVRG